MVLNEGRRRKEKKRENGRGGLGWIEVKWIEVDWIWIGLNGRDWLG